MTPYSERWHGHEEEPPHVYVNRREYFPPVDDEDEAYDEELEEYITQLFKYVHVPHYDWDTRAWVCTCKRFLAHGKCEHVIRFRPLETLLVDPEFL